VIKRDILLRRTIKAGNSLCDLAMGKAGDLHKWISAGVGRVFGCDIAAANLNDPEDGAYRRLLDKMVTLGGRDRVPPMTFVQADASKRLSDGDAGATAEDKALLASVFAPGSGQSPFDVVSCMFATHYMLRDENTLAGFLTNLADTVKVGGYFVGCGFDGDAVARLLSSEQTVVGRDGATDVWAITKRYGTAIGSSVPPSAAGLGLTIDVDFISIGDTHPEYLVSFPYLQSRLAEAGLDLLTAEEYGALGLPASTQMFGDTWNFANATGKPYNMSEAEKRMSFLNRWYVFVRRSDRRPAPPALVAAAAPSLVAEGIGLGATGLGSNSAASAAVASSFTESKTGYAGDEAVGLDVIDLPEAEDRQYRIDAATVTPDLRLGSELSDWPRYMSTGTLVEIADSVNPTIKYPSVEAAIASGKYQRATNKPELGPKLFAVEGSVHQKYEAERVKAAGDEAAIRRATDDELNMIRTVSGKNSVKKYKGEWNQTAWDAARDEVYRTYLSERYRIDARFRTMVQMIKEKGGEILFVNGVDPSPLGVGVRADGSLAGGDNLVGKWIMDLAKTA
jgi:mRNA (guanine-N7-)-methyltransferase